MRTKYPCEIHHTHTNTHTEKLSTSVRHTNRDKTHFALLFLIRTVVYYNIVVRRFIVASSSSSRRILFFSLFCRWLLLWCELIFFSPFTSPSRQIVKYSNISYRTPSRRDDRPSRIVHLQICIKDFNCGPPNPHTAELKNERNEH